MSTHPHYHARIGGQVLRLDATETGYTMPYTVPDCPTCGGDHDYGTEDDVAPGDGLVRCAGCDGTWTILYAPMPISIDTATGAGVSSAHDMSLRRDALHTLPTYGARLKVARRTAGLTQMAVCDLTGLTQSYLSGLEASRYPNVTLRTAHKLAALYRVPLGLLFPAED